MKRAWLVPVCGLAAITIFVAWKTVVASGDPGMYYEYRRSQAGFAYPTRAVLQWTGLVIGELGLVSFVIARAKKPAHATLIGALWFFIVLLSTGMLAMHAPPYFVGFVIAQLLACVWLVVATGIVALLGLTQKSSNP